MTDGRINGELNEGVKKFFSLTNQLAREEVQRCAELLINAMKVFRNSRKHLDLYLSWM